MVRQADSDMTGMALQSLAPYYSRDPAVQEAVDRAIARLSQMQNDDGGYSSWGTANSESIAQVVVALTALGIDPATDARFVKNGNSAIDALAGILAIMKVGWYSGFSFFRNADHVAALSYAITINAHYFWNMSHIGLESISLCNAEFLDHFIKLPKLFLWDVKHMVRVPCTLDVHTSGVFHCIDICS